MTLKLIATDMDGTFLDQNGHFDKERFERILAQLEERGILFVVATGNQISRMRHVFGDLTDRLTFVAGNGSHVVERGQTLVLKKLSSDLIQHFFDYYKDDFANFHIVVSSPEKAYMTKAAFTCNNLSSDGLTYYNNSFPGVILVDNPQDIPRDNINKITMKVPLEQEEELFTDFRAEFSDLVPMASGFGALDVVLPGINKAWGLKQLMTKHQILAIEAMAFGDGSNDLDMFEIVDFSYAMANAPEDIKVQARYLAPTNSEAGVLTVIEDYFKNEKK